MKNGAKNLDSQDETKDEASEPTQGEKELRIASVVQLHKLEGTAIRRGPGRPKKPDQETIDQLAAYHAEMAREQVAFVDNDPIVKASGARKESAEMLHLVRQRLARVHAQLDFRRIEDEKTGGKESAQIQSRQVAVLREIAGIELKIKELGAQQLDLYGEGMQQVFAIFVERIQKVAKEVLPQAQSDLFFNRLETALVGWEEEAESRIR